MAKRTKGEMKRVMNEKIKILALIVPEMVEKKILFKESLPDVHSTFGISSFKGQLQLLVHAYSEHEDLINKTTEHCTEYLEAAEDLRQWKRQRMG